VQLKENKKSIINLNSMKRPLIGPPISKTVRLASERKENPKKEIEINI
jgi:hypothetical protein